MTPKLRFANPLIWWVWGGLIRHLYGTSYVKLFLFMCGLFNDGLNNLKHVVSKGRTLDQSRIRNCLKQRVVICRFLPHKTEKTTKTSVKIVRWSVKTRYEDLSSMKRNCRWIEGDVWSWITRQMSYTCIPRYTRSHFTRFRYNAI